MKKLIISLLCITFMVMHFSCTTSKENQQTTHNEEATPQTSQNTVTKTEELEEIADIQTKAPAEPTPESEPVPAPVVEEVPVIPTPTPPTPVMPTTTADKAVSTGEDESGAQYEIAEEKAANKTLYDRELQKQRQLEERLAKNRSQASSAGTKAARKEAERLRNDISRAKAEQEATAKQRKRAEYAMEMKRAAKPKKRVMPPVPPPPPPMPPPKPVLPGDIATEKDKDFNTEDYNSIVENEFQEVVGNPLSTFSIDVDAASYSNTRRFINSQNILPPKDAVRIEEFINYFTYDYPQPKDEHPFSITTEIADCPWNKDHLLAHIGLQGEKLDLGQAPPTNLVFLIDVSGSMGNANKLPLLKQSLKMLTEEMRPQDRVAIVVYASATGLVLPSTPFSQKDKIIAALDNLKSGGSTAGGAGIQLAYQVAQENFVKKGNNRVILATDGDFNVGVSSDAALVKLIEEKRKSDIFLTVLGFGMGNYKDNKMEQLADKGNGNYAYIDNIMEAKKVLVNEMTGTLFAIAKDVKLQVEFNPTKVKAYRLIGYENRKMAAEDFDDDTKDAGELGAGHTVTALYEIIPANAESKEAVRSTPALKYQTTKINASAQNSGELMTVKFRYKKPDGDKSSLIVHPVAEQTVGQVSDNFKFSAAVAGWGMMLRGSKFKGDCSHKMILNMAKQSKGKDDEGYRAEFIRLVEKSNLL